jgi:hypothetical protein
MPPDPLKSWIIGQLKAATRQAEALRLLAVDIERSGRVPDVTVARAERHAESDR